MNCGSALVRVCSHYQTPLLRMFGQFDEVWDIHQTAHETAEKFAAFLLSAFEAQ